MNVRTDVIWRMAIVGIIIAILLSVIIGVSFVIMTLDRDNYLKYEAKDRKIVLQPRRGDILTEDGKPLATSVPFYDIYVDMRKSYIPDSVFNRGIDSLSICLSRLFSDKSSREYLRLLRDARRKNSGYYLIHRRASIDEFYKMKNFPIFRRGKSRGGYIPVERGERIQPLGGIGGRMIGECFGNNGKGRSGLEEYFNDKLEGIPGIGVVRRGAGSSLVVSVEEPVNGMDIITTVSIPMQDIVSSALYDGLMYQNADKGCAILMEVKTGDIKAMANLTRVGKGIYAEIENMAIGNAGDPGSVMKTASVITLFEDGKYTPYDTVRLGGKGYYTFRGRSIKESSGHKSLDVVTIKDMYKMSSNGFSKVVFDSYGNNPAKFLDYWYDMRLNQKVGICLSGEGTPDIKHPDSTSWDRNFNNLPWMSIGYSLTITPLQLCAFYNAVANGGQRMKPRLVKEIQRNGRTYENIPVEEVGNRIFSNRTKGYMDTLMQAVVNEKGGTAYRIRSNDYKIAGKTGTAYTLFKGSYNSSNSRCTFAGFFPADQPEYTCIVVIDGPRVNSSGGAVSGPVFKTISDRIMVRNVDFEINKGKLPERLPLMKNGYVKDIDLICKELNINLDLKDREPDWGRTDVGQEGIEITGVTVKEGVVPNAVGMGLRDAVYVMEKAGLRVMVSGVGRVYSQSLVSGRSVPSGGTVYLNLR